MARAIPLARQVHGPDEIARQWRWHVVLDRSPEGVDVVAMLADDLGDKALARCCAVPDFRMRRVPPVECRRDQTTTRPRHQRFQADDFVADPNWLGRSRRIDGEALLRRAVRWCFGTTPSQRCQHQRMKPCQPSQNSAAIAISP